MEKKILFMSSAKLTALSVGLLLAVFCTIGMSFTPVEEEIIETNDSTSVPSPQKNVRKSHWTEGSGCDAQEHKEKDWGKATIYTMGNGKVTLSSTGGGVVKTPSGYVENTVLKSGNSDGDNVSITWNCNETSTSGTETNHKRKFTYTAIADDGYYFDGWSTTSDGSDRKKEKECTEEMFLEDYNSGINYINETSPKQLTYYAHFKPEAIANITFAVSENGSYTYATEDITPQEVSAYTGNKTLSTKKVINLVATPSSGYKFFGWYKNADSPSNYVGYSATLSLSFDSDVTLYAKFIPVNQAIFTIKNTTQYFYDLNQAAVIAATSGSKILVPTIDGEVPAGNYEIPSGVTLLIPFDNEYTLYRETPEDVHAGPANQSAYRTLTLLNGANIVVRGKLSVSAKMQRNIPYGGGVYGKYGKIALCEGSTITINSEATLYCWGYITGKGTVTAKDGSTIWEFFQVACWRGGNCASSVVNKHSTYKVFPLAQYYIQNVESKMIIESGATENVYTGVGNVNLIVKELEPRAPALLIGKNSGLFQISSGTLTKWYDATKDRQMYQIDGESTLGSVSISMYVDIRSEEYVLPLTNNMDITVNTGTFTCNQEIAILPGANITINEGANVSFGSSGMLYVYDKAEWPEKENGYNWPYNVAFCKVAYTDTKITTARTYANMADAKLDVNGTFTTANGHFYTTTGGADICSSKGTGKIVYIWSPGTELTTYQVVQDGNKVGTWAEIAITPARLHNSDAFKNTYGASLEYLPTAGSAANTTVTYANGHWGWVEVWKNGEDVLAAANTVSKVNNAEAKNSLIASIVAPEGYEIAAEKWETTVDNENQEVIHSVKFVKIVTITWDLDNGSPNEVTYVKEGEMPTHETPEKPASVSEVFTFNKWLDGNGNYYTTDNLPAATIDATYKATYNASTRQYTVTWRNPDGTPLKSEQWGYGTQPNYSTTGETPTYSDGKKLYAFRGWKYERTGVEYGKDESLELVAGDETYTALYDVVAVLIIEEDRTYSADVEVETTTVRVQGKLGVSAGKTFETEDLILEGSLDSSGEIENNGTINATNVYFDLSNGTEGFKARTWYAIAVPWQVDVKAYAPDNGVYIINGSTAPVRQKMGTTFDLLYYDGARRATGASKAWNYVEDDPETEHIMYPGRAYMIYLTSNADVIRFERKEGTPLHSTNVETKKYPAQGVSGGYADWNGIANPATYHAYLNVGATENRGQIYNADTKQYNLFNMSENKLVVGQPIFVQPAEETTIVANANVYNPSPAPLRAQGQDKILARCEVMLAKTDEAVSDRVIVRMDEEKEENEYVVGQDLVKMGVSDIVPQMWIDRYASKMCINTVAPVNNIANYPLSISVQRDGEYELFIADQPTNEVTLYLTYDGQPIWNLGYAGYVANLTKGTNTHYGLRIVVKSPEIATGIDEAVVDARGETRKVLINDQVFIIRGEKVYSIDGKLVK